MRNDAEERWDAPEGPVTLVKDFRLLPRCLHGAPKCFQQGSSNHMLWPEPRRYHVTCAVA